MTQEKKPRRGRLFVLEKRKRLMEKKPPTQ